MNGVEIFTTESGDFWRVFTDLVWRVQGKGPAVYMYHVGSNGIDYVTGWTPPPDVVTKKMRRPREWGLTRKRAGR